MSSVVLAHRADICVVFVFALTNKTNKCADPLSAVHDVPFHIKYGPLILCSPAPDQWVASGGGSWGDAGSWNSSHAPCVDANVSLPAEMHSYQVRLATSATLFTSVPAHRRMIIDRAAGLRDVRAVR